MSPWDKRERATPWYRRWIDPVTDALYKRELSRARELLYAGRLAAARGDIAPAEAAAKAGYLLDYMEYHIAKVIDAATALEQCSEFDERLSRVCPNPHADALRRKLLLQFRCSAERIGYRELAVFDFQQLYDSVPASERNDEFWHFVSSWAFTHYHTGILEHAYEEYSFNVGSFMTDWLYWRVRLMYLLSAGQATEEDVRHLLDHLTIIEHLNDFEHKFVPALKRADMWGPVLMEVLETRRVAIQGATAEDIQREVAE
jgi:hypothetical protein